MIPERREMQEYSIPLRQQVSPAKIREVDNKIAQKVEAYKQLAKEVTSANKFLAKQEVKLARVQQEIEMHTEKRKAIISYAPQTDKETARNDQDFKKINSKLKKLDQQKNELLQDQFIISGKIGILKHEWQRSEKELLGMHLDVKEIHPKRLKSLPELKKISEKVVRCFDESPVTTSKPLAHIKQLKQQLWEIQGTPLENLWESKQVQKPAELAEILGRLYMYTKSPYPTPVRKEAQKLINTIDQKKLTFNLSKPLMELCQSYLQAIADKKIPPETKSKIAHLYVELERADQFAKNDRSLHYEKQGRDPQEVRTQIEEMQKKLAEAYKDLEKT